MTDRLRPGNAAEGPLAKLLQITDFRAVTGRSILPMWHCGVHSSNLVRHDTIFPDRCPRFGDSPHTGFMLGAAVVI